MAITKNAGSIFLASANPRLLTQPNADIILSSTAPLFHTNSAGVPDTSSIIITATLISLEGTVTFSASGATLSSVSGNTAVLAFTGMTGTTATITATLTYRGNVFTKSRVISVVSDGSAVTSYTWIKYADDAVGTGISDSPVGKKYLGLGQNKTTATESNIPADYSWSLITGTDGVPGTPGADGLTLFTWIKYSDNADGTGLYDIPTTTSLYIGISPNRTTATESTLKTDYVWSKFKGDQGVPGNAGSSGSRGAGTYYATGSAWVDSTADAATPGVNVIDDLVTISNGTTYALTKRWDGSAWVAIGTVIDGNLLVTASVSAAKVNSNGLTIRKADGTIILDAGGGGLQAGFEAPGTLNSALVPSITAASKIATDVQIISLKEWVGTGRHQMSGNRITGASGVFSYAAGSSNSQKSGAYGEFTPDANVYFVGGLTTDTTSPLNILYGFIARGDNTMLVRNSSSDITSLGAFVPTDVFTVKYDGSSVYYFKNGVQVYSVAGVATGQSLYFLTSIVGGGISGVRFGPLTSNNWGDIGGTGKPADFATLGATIGTNLSGQMTAANISTYIAGAAIDIALIKTASIGSLSALSATIGTLRTATSGARTEISDNVIKVYDSSNVLRVQIGDLSL